MEGEFKAMDDENERGRGGGGRVDEETVIESGEKWESN